MTNDKTLPDDEAFSLFLLGYYEGVLSDNDSEADMIAVESEEAFLDDLREHCRDAQNGEWTFPTDRE